MRTKRPRFRSAGEPPAPISVKSEGVLDDPTACLICMDPTIRGGYGVDLLKCSGCRTMMHGACAGDAWSKKCPQCKTETVGKWRRPEADRELVGEIEEEGEDENVKDAVPLLGSRIKVY